MAANSTSTQTTRKRGSGSAGSARKNSRKKSRTYRGSLLLAIWAGLTSLYGGRIVLGVILATLIIWLEALVLKHQYVLFFRTVGVEILLALFIGWIFFMIQGSRQE